MSDERQIKHAVLNILGFYIEGRLLSRAVDQIMSLFDISTHSAEDHFPEEIWNNPEYRLRVEQDISELVARFAAPKMDISLTSRKVSQDWKPMYRVRAELQVINFKPLRGPND